ncbi:hypothetical protein M9H77_07170 [Catharanthus roseus]|uniref:Uncharacterized protein n=1 Tax=Catharanthus roseus TaxID=4058 RepID=A0ACC0BU58_CATRO|nr:hypothetical protein M9H77_07170 [Catharanthus roseus]
MQLLREALIEARLVDVGHGGGDFTWYNETEGRAAMWERLDRCVINDRWKELFPDLHDQQKHGSIRDKVRKLTMEVQRLREEGKEGLDLNLLDTTWKYCNKNRRNIGKFGLGRIGWRTRHGTKMRDLIDPITRSRKVELLNSLFLQRDVEEIRKFSLSSVPSKDVLIWHYEKIGWLTIWAWILWPDVLIRVRKRVKLWGITGPPKVKLLGWKVFNDIVPTRANLRRRNILVDPPCPRCNREEENSVHVFFNCPWVRRVWRAWKIDIRRAVRDWRSCKDIIWNILQLPQIKEGEGGTLNLRMLWCIWNDRNKFLFENRTSWTVVRDDKGELIAVTVVNLQGISKASFDEVMAIWKGIELAKEFGFLKLVVVQSDCEPIVEEKQKAGRRQQRKQHSSSTAAVSREAEERK